MMKPIRFVALFGLAASAVYLFYPRTGNDPLATRTHWGGHCSIHLSGRRYQMVHDPVSLLLRKTYAAKVDFDLPCRDGDIDGAEIHSSEGSLPVVGSVSIAGDTLVVHLADSAYLGKPQVDMAWNGRYRLVDYPEQ